MNNTTRITAALRMSMMKRGSASARFISDSALATKSEAVKAGWPEERIVEIGPDTANEDLKKVPFTHDVHIVVIQHQGVVLLARTADEVEKLAKSQKLPGIHQQIDGRASGKIAIVTGAAQGFGQGIAESLFTEGANVVIADLNSDKGNELAAQLNEKQTTNRAFFVKCDVSNAQSVEQMVEVTVNHFGGLDILISNAGILRAGSLEEMTPETFDLMTRVNYNGFFHCARAGAPVMKLQWEINPFHFADIIQINSKSGLKGSNKNFAYAGAKFGGIGLVQSFALELMPYQVKVNAICPGNFFEGPLWSDPENGLFVQYLNAGKIPGAKTIGDVKNHYESQVPAGRGCRVKDVVRAILYAVEQEYETGQAIPVTGGQEMLR